MKKLVVTILFSFLISQIIEAQSGNDTSFGSHVVISSNIDSLYYTVKTDCNKSDLRNDSLVIPSLRRCVRGKKDTTLAVTPINARANISIDTKDKSRLRINYWSFKSHVEKLKTEKAVSVQNNNNICTPAHNSFSVAKSLKIIKNQKEYSQCDRYHANQKIRKTSFFVPFENREAKTFTFYSGNVTAITLPIKYYMPINENGVKVPSRAITSLNGNVYFNMRYGEAKYYYERDSNRKIYMRNQVSAGILTGLSLTEINTENTLIRESKGDMLTASRYAPTFSIGAGLTYGFRQFTFGVFTGLDYTIGTDRDYWDYQGKPWIGFGITVSSLLSVL